MSGIRSWAGWGQYQMSCWSKGCWRTPWNTNFRFPGAHSRHRKCQSVKNWKVPRSFIWFNCGTLRAVRRQYKITFTHGCLRGCAERILTPFLSCFSKLLPCLWPSLVIKPFWPRAEFVCSAALSVPREPHSMPRWEHRDVRLPAALPAPWAGLRTPRDEPAPHTSLSRTAGWGRGGAETPTPCSLRAFHAPREHSALLDEQQTPNSSPSEQGTRAAPQGCDSENCPWGTGLPGRGWAWKCCSHPQLSSSWLWRVLSIILWMSLPSSSKGWSILSSHSSSCYQCLPSRSPLCWLYCFQSTRTAWKWDLEFAKLFLSSLHCSSLTSAHPHVLSYPTSCVHLPSASWCYMFFA